MFRFAFSLFLLIAIAGKAFADGGTVQISREEGPYRITVFSASALVRAGPEDISVLVQDRITHQPLLDREVRLSFRRLDQKPAAAGEAWVPPCCRMKSSGGLHEIQATHQLATNKLLYAASVTLPEAGKWEVKTEVRTTTHIVSAVGRIQVAPPAPPFLTYWPFFLFPVVAIVGYLLHAHLCKKSMRRLGFVRQLS